MYFQVFGLDEDGARFSEVYEANCAAYAEALCRHEGMSRTVAAVIQVEDAEGIETDGSADYLEQVRDELNLLRGDREGVFEDFGDDTTDDLPEDADEPCTADFRTAEEN